MVRFERKRKNARSKILLHIRLMMPKECSGKKEGLRRRYKKKHRRRKI